MVSRVFVPGGGVDEDSVTGSAHAALTPFWAARLGRDSFTAHQASERGGDLTCRLEGDRAWLGGAVRDGGRGELLPAGVELDHVGHLADAARAICSPSEWPSRTTTSLRSGATSTYWPMWPIAANRLFGPRSANSGSSPSGGSRLSQVCAP